MIEIFQFNLECYAFRKCYCLKLGHFQLAFFLAKYVVSTMKKTNPTTCFSHGSATHVACLGHE